MPATANELLDRVFRDPAAKQGLRFFTKGERNRLQLREGAGDKIDIWCFKREKFLRAKPEEVVRQLFLVWVQETLKYPLKRVLVEWPIQMGEDDEKERADIAVFTDDACTDPYLVFELKKPDGKEGLEQLRSYLRWTGCFFWMLEQWERPFFSTEGRTSGDQEGPVFFSRHPAVAKAR